MAQCNLALSKHARGSWAEYHGADRVFRARLRSAEDVDVYARWLAGAQPSSGTRLSELTHNKLYERLVAAEGRRLDGVEELHLDIADLWDLDVKHAETVLRLTAVAMPWVQRLELVVRDDAEFVPEALPEWRDCLERLTLRVPAFFHGTGRFLDAGNWQEFEALRHVCVEPCFENRSLQVLPWPGTDEVGLDRLSIKLPPLESFEAACIDDWPDYQEFQTESRE